MTPFDNRFARAASALRAIDRKINIDAAVRSGAAEGHVMTEVERMAALRERRLCWAEYVEARATAFAIRRFPPLPSGRAALGLLPAVAA